MLIECRPPSWIAIVSQTRRLADSQTSALPPPDLACPFRPLQPISPSRSHHLTSPHLTSHVSQLSSRSSPRRLSSTLTWPSALTTYPSQLTSQLTSHLTHHLALTSRAHLTPSLPLRHNMSRPPPRTHTHHLAGLSACEVTTCSSHKSEKPT